MPRSNLQIGIATCQSNNCKVLTLTDSTGQQTITNTTGYGDGFGPDPNTETTQIYKVVLDVTTPEGNTFTFDSSGGSAKDALLDAAFPDITGTAELPLLAEDLGGSAGTALADGIYTLNMTASCLINPGPNAIDYEEYAYLRIFLTCNAHCCVDKLFHIAASEANCVSCKQEKLDTALQAQAYLKSAEFAAACGKYNMALQLLEKVQWICNTKNCNNC